MQYLIGSIYFLIIPQPSFVLSLSIDKGIIYLKNRATK